MALPQILLASQIAATLGGTALNYKQQADARSDAKSDKKELFQSQQDYARAKMQAFVQDRTNTINAVADYYKKNGKDVSGLPKPPQMPSADYIFTPADLALLGVKDAVSEVKVPDVNYGALVGNVGSGLAQASLLSGKDDPNKELKDEVKGLELTQKKNDLEARKEALLNSGLNKIAAETTKPSTPGILDTLWSTEKAAAPPINQGSDIIKSIIAPAKEPADANALPFKPIVSDKEDEEDKI